MGQERGDRSWRWPVATCGTSEHHTAHEPPLCGQLKEFSNLQVLVSGLVNLPTNMLNNHSQLIALIRLKSVPVITQEPQGAKLRPCFFAKMHYRAEWEEQEPFPVWITAEDNISVPYRFPSCLKHTLSGRVLQRGGKSKRRVAELWSWGVGSEQWEEGGAILSCPSKAFSLLFHISVYLPTSLCLLLAFISKFHGCCVQGKEEYAIIIY